MKNNEEKIKMVEKHGERKGDKNHEKLSIRGKKKK